MTADEAVAALEVSARARVDRRIPKTLLLEHGAPTAADRRHISGEIEEVKWVAILKPATIGVAAYRDDVREYLEIAVLRVMLRSTARGPRLLELVHRAVPYPVFAITELGTRVNLSLAHKRWSQGEHDRTVLDGELEAADAPRVGEAHADAFARALAASHQPRASLLEFYQGWIDTVLALQAARLTKRFSILPTPEGRAARREALRDCARLDADLARLRAAAAKEKQMPRRVQLNLEVKRAEAAQAIALAQL